MHITILLTLSIPPGEAKIPVYFRWDAQLHPEPPGSDLKSYYPSTRDECEGVEFVTKLNDFLDAL